MPSWWTGKPLLITIAVLFAIVFLRAQLTYWAGRAVSEGASRTRLSGWLSGPKVVRAAGLINRWGPPVITVSFLTVGFQTVVNAAAGLSRMPFLRYLLAMIPGCIAWAAIYATIGLAALGAAVAVAAKSPWALVGAALAITGTVAALLWRRKSRV